jgi:protein SCO1/2
MVSKRNVTSRMSPLAWLNKGIGLVLLAHICLLPTPVLGQLPAPRTGIASSQLPGSLRGVGLDQHLGAQVPLDLVFRNEQGQAVRLAEYFGHRPLIIALVYYQCPMLCNEVLNGLVSSIGVLSFDVGKHFDVVTLSFDPRDGPELAAVKKENYLRRYRRPGAASGWHFLTGKEESIRALTQSVGFSYAFDPASGQFAHATGIMVLTPQGKIARYFYGIEYAPKDLRLSLVEASAGKIGSPIDQILLFCYHYDPSTGKYSAVVLNFLKLCAGLTLLGLAVLFFILHRKMVRHQAVRLGGTA